MGSKSEASRQAPRGKDYESQFKLHIIKAKIDGLVFGNIYLTSLSVDHIAKLDILLKAKALKANSVNSIVHGSSTAMLKDARRTGS